MSTRLKILILLLLVAAIAAGAVANRGDGDGGGAPTAPTAGEGGEFADACGKDELELVEPGVLTIGAASPSRLPWLSPGEPAPEGFEPDLARAVAEFMGFAGDELRWVDVPRRTLLESGPLGVDFALGQIVPTSALDVSMDFSEPYYDVEQAVLVLDSSELAAGATLEDLREVRIGAPAGPSHDAVLSAIRPTVEAAVYGTPAAAVAALRDGAVDAVVADYPTALGIARAPRARVAAIGRLPVQGDVHFGLVTAEGSPLRACLSTAVANVRQQEVDLGLAQAWIEPEAPPVLSP